MEKFECREPVSNTYRLTLVKRIKLALALAQKLSLRVDTRGVLSMQFMVENKDAQVTFIEVYVSRDLNLVKQINPIPFHYGIDPILHPLVLWTTADAWSRG